MNDEQLLRYSRQIMLPEIDVIGQQKLLDSHVLIIGMGGLGSPVAMYLASAGIGNLTLVDDDKVELSNLQRQIAHTQNDIGKYKTDSAKETLLSLNPDINVTTINHRMNENELINEIQKSDVVIDATDNFTTRFSINKACVKTGTPLVSGAAIRMEAQITVFNNDKKDSPCYHCLYKEGDELDESCTETGVLAPLVGIIGSIQALETIKILLGFGETLTGKLLLLDAKTMEWRSIKLGKDPACPVCA
ncbi:MAG: molybdopterin-synthase adenylyltransferase MoeB [Gammaproteobacteria bacterium]|nr:molybdopterin-synthase adenylyltransferase MoeB [Gammaproteobacteria bacterium]MDH5593439.1 molybdopterin-synthase adenylyltransferase MoeB [Gammaproteobacteria bacterium]MDH5614159.1 molybdopterin-synthase adenylyltransferase MoeB [Gammaproteobacteria bacterium]